MRSALLSLVATAVAQRDHLPRAGERGPGGSVTPPDQMFGQYCVSNLDCSLNGICDTKTGFCECDPAWTGKNCGVLNVLPAKVANGYNRTNSSSWGASVIADAEDAGKWHMFVEHRLVQLGRNI